MNSASGRSLASVAKAASISRLVLALIERSCSPWRAAAASTSRRLAAMIVGSAGLMQHGDPLGRGHQCPQQLQPLRRQLGREEIDSGRIAARPGEARDKAEPDRVFGHENTDRDRRGRLGRGHRRRRAGRDDHVDAPANELGRQHRQPAGLFSAQR